MFNFLGDLASGFRDLYRDPTATDLPQEVQDQLARQSQVKAGLAMLAASAGRPGQPMRGLGEIASEGVKVGEESFKAGLERQRDAQGIRESRTFGDEINALGDNRSARYDKALQYARNAMARGDFQRAQWYQREAQNYSPKELIKMGADDNLYDPNTGQTVVKGQRKPGQLSQGVNPATGNTGFFSVGADGKPVFLDGVGVPVDQTADQRNYQQAMRQKYGENPARWEQFDAWLQRSAAQRAPRVDVSFPNAAGKEMAGVLSQNFERARGAVAQADTAQRLMRVLDGNGFISGPMADTRVEVSRLANLLGVGGRGNEEKLANTAVLVRELANLTLAARQQMRGQGAITESESRLAERAASGDISMTGAELRALAAAAHRAAKYQRTDYKRMLERARPTLGAMADLYEMDDIPEESPSKVMEWKGVPSGR